MPYSIHSLENNLRLALNNTQQVITKLEQESNSRFNNIFNPLQDKLYYLNQAWGLINHLLAVCDNKALRDLHQKYLPIINDFYTMLSQNQNLYQHITKIRQEEYPYLNAEQQKIVANELRDFKLNGVGLDFKLKEEFKKIQNKLSQLSTKFEQNVLDATDEFKLQVKLEDLDGVPPSILNQYLEPDGNYIIRLQIPSYLPIMQYAKNRSLRERLYYAYITRSSDLGNPAWDNSLIINEILALRDKKAKLLDFNNYVEYSLETKMASSYPEISKFLNDLATQAKSFAENELAELASYAKKMDGLEQIEAWDLAYYSEKLLEEKFNYSNHELKQYFQAPQVIQGLFSLIKQLYSVEFKLENQTLVWHQEVIVYSLLQNKKLVGYLFLDLYARESKQSGAWMHSAKERYLFNKELTHPEAYIICNFTPPTAESPSLLTLDEVQTLFHEMGHALHQLLTQIDNPTISGINGVEWDGVELPSQFMEYFTWDYNLISKLSSQITTGRKLPKELFDKVLAARHYQTGLQTLRQVEFALFDLELHLKPKVDYLEVYQEIHTKIGVSPSTPYNRFPHSFLHIFAGGYAAGYYSYKWAEVLASDVFSLFDGVPINSLNNLGSKFEATILANGGLYSMLDNFKAFMGREPKINALLKYSGLQ